MLEAYESKLSDSDKRKLNELFKEELGAQKEIIRDNILRDREHLRLVNFCVSPFLYRGTLGAETRYLLVRVEPLLKLGIKNFEAAIYNKDSKVILLVECKSSIARVGEEVDHTMLAANQAISRKKDLDDLVGDTISITETVICTNAAYAARVKEYVGEKDLPLCLWSADQWTRKLLLEKQGEDPSVEIAKGRRHSDAKLCRLLINGVSSTGVKPIPFLPSSHPCTILEEILPLLHLALERTGQDRFKLSDLHALLKIEASLLNVSDEELSSLCEQIVRRGLEPEIFHDCSTSVGELKNKEFEIAVRKGSVRAMTEDVRKKYTELSAARKAEQKSLQKFQESQSKEFKKLDEFSK